MRTKLPALFAAIILSFAVLAGCGGDEESGTSVAGGAAAGDGSAATDAGGAGGAGGGGGGNGSAGQDTGGAGAGTAADDDAPADRGGGASGDGSAAGGGGGSGGEAQTRPESGAQPSPREKFIEAANAICLKSSARVKEQVQPYLERKVAKKEEGEVLAEVVAEVFVPAVEQEAGEIRALGIPAGDEAQIEAIFTSMRQVLKRAQTNPLAFQQTVEPFEEPEELAIAYGLGSCGGL